MGDATRLRLRDGLRWRGHLRLGPRVQGGYVVDWDAEVVGAVGHERRVLDRCVLTAQQVRDWTGHDPEGDDSG